ncbi:MAG: nickel pincer cofactor biosynthesis protein LarC [Caldilineaceae bacterium]|nr:nickel pincer cofactor biosynthesis protein LarC [Caldilineaceae bacterium]
MIAYLDMPSGISGDMFLGCLIDAGWPMDALHAVIRSLDLPTDKWQVRAEKVMRGALSATLVHVEVAEDDTHRHLHHIRQIITAANLPRVVKERSVAVFQRLAAAEAAIHGVSIDEIHFHEVGALDAIIDVVGVVSGLHALGVQQLYAGGVPLGEGWTRSAHGRIPLPAPATLALLAAANAPNRPAPGSGELVTPTGAALLAELAIFQQPPMRLHTIGYGAGQKEFEWPNVARLWLATAPGAGTLPSPSLPAEGLFIRGDGIGVLPAQAESGEQPKGYFVQLETNIDDMSPELYGAARACLFEAGALDVWTTPIQMKKERPGTLLSVLAPVDLEETIATTVLRETTSLGVRIHPVYRYEAQREMRTVQTPYGPVRVKLKWVDGKLEGVKAEYEDCRALAEASDLSVRSVYEAAQVAAYGELGR